MKWKIKKKTLEIILSTLETSGSVAECRLFSKARYIENTSWKVRAYGIYARVVDVSEIERVSAANE